MNTVIPEYVKEQAELPKLNHNEVQKGSLVCVCPCLRVRARVIVSVCKYVLLTLLVLSLSDKREALTCETVLDL